MQGAVFVLSALAFAWSCTALKTSFSYRGFGLDDASKFLDDVIKILDRPEMSNHIKLAAGGDGTETQLVLMQFMPLGNKYGTDASKFMLADGRGLSWNQFCVLSEEDQTLRNKVEAVSTRWKDIVGSFDEAPKFTKKQAMALVDDSNSLFSKADVKECLKSLNQGEEQLGDCWEKLSNHMLKTHGLKPYNIPQMMPQILMHAKDDHASRDKVMKFSQDWARMAEEMGVSTSEKKAPALAGKSTGMSKAYAIAFVDAISKEMDTAQFKQHMKDFRGGDPCAELAISNSFKPICSKHGFAASDHSMPPVWQLAALGPELKDKIWDVVLKWADNFMD